MGCGEGLERDVGRCDDEAEDRQLRVLEAEKDESDHDERNHVALLAAFAAQLFDVDDALALAAELPAALFGGGLDLGERGRLDAFLEHDRCVAHVDLGREVDLRVDAGGDALVGSMRCAEREQGDDGDDLVHGSLSWVELGRTCWVYYT